jgi:nitric oxide reductase NorD protein
VSEPKTPGPERLKLLASAVAGRPVTVAALDPPGTAAWTDGTTVFVDPAAATREQVRYVAVQAALLSSGSLDAEFLSAIARRPALCRRYLAVEGHRALAAHQGLLPPSARLLIDRRMAARSGSPAQSLAIAMSREVVADAPHSFGTIRPRRLRSDLGKSAETNAAAQHVPRQTDAHLLRELDDEEDDGGALFDTVSSPVGGGGGIGRLIKRLLGDARSGDGGPPGADAVTHRSRRGGGRPAAGTTTTAITSLTDSMEDAAHREWIYPEWDLHRHRYRPDWCTVSESEPAAAKLAPFELPDTHSLRRTLARLGREWQRRPRQLQGIDIDIDAAVAAYVDVVAGSPPAEEVYIDILRQRRDLAVLILLDISGSAGEPSPSGGMVHDHQRAAAAALVRSMHDLGDRVALYSFCSQGRTAVHVVPMKQFRESLETRVLQRLGGTSPGAYTRLGAAIRHGSAVVERDGGTTRRLLVVLSDGFAYDHGYEGAYGEADARRALAEARRRGTACLCLSMGAPTDTEALRRVFGTAAHARVPRVEDLPAMVGPLFRFALRSAEAQQRTFQRKLRTKERLEVERRTA